MNDLPTFLNQALVGNLTVGQAVLIGILALAGIGALTVLGLLMRIPRLVFGPGCGCFLLLIMLVLGLLVVYRP